MGILFIRLREETKWIVHKLIFNYVGQKSVKNREIKSWYFNVPYVENLYGFMEIIKSTVYYDIYE